MLDQTVVQKLRERYPDLHPLLFHRSVERAKSNGDLFDILDTVPQQYPLVWAAGEGGRGRWASVADLYLSEDMKG